MTTKLKFQSVTSKNLTAVAYDDAKKRLHVIFISGAEYAYAAPETARRALLAESERVDRKVFGASVGALFNRAIRDKFPAERVDVTVESAREARGREKARTFADRYGAATPPGEVELRLGGERRPEPSPAAQDFYDAAGDLLSGGERTR
jgi:hypothetical protein